MIRTRLILKLAGGIFLAVICWGSLGFAYYRAAQRSLWSEVQEHMMSIGRAIAQTLDPEAHEALWREQRMDSRRFREMLDDLHRLTRIFLPEAREAGWKWSHESIYTLKPSGESTWHFVLDSLAPTDRDRNGRIDSDEAPARLGEPYDSNQSPNIRRCYETGQPTADDKLTQDKWGVWLSGYAPLKDKAGRVIAVIEVDMNVSTLHGKETLLRRTAWLMFTIMTVLTFMAALLFHRFQLEREKSERLLLNVLPAPIANRLKRGEQTITDSHPEASILFADLADFTPMSAAMSPAELVASLNELFSAFDRLVEKHGLEKIKTIGDAYMAAGGLPMPHPTHAFAVAELALDMIEEANRRGTATGRPLSLRIGIATGPVVAGVIGSKKFSYDLWGDTVNTASRMESHGIPNAIQVTAETHARLRDEFQFEERGTIEVKGKGPMRTYLLKNRKAPRPCSEATH